MPGQVTAPVFVDALTRVRSAARKHRKACGLLVPDGAAAAAKVDEGWTFVTIGSGSTLLATAATAHRAQARDGRARWSGVMPLQATPSYNASKAAIRMLSESVRLQWADTSVTVVELVPPAVRTELLPGQEDSESAMPLEEYVSEAVGLLESQPEARQILVERVKSLRFAEARRTYDEVVATLNARDPHGSWSAKGGSPASSDEAGLPVGGCRRPQPPRTDWMKETTCWTS